MSFTVIPRFRQRNPAIFLSEGASEFGAKVVLFQMGDGIGMPQAFAF